MGLDPKVQAALDSLNAAAANLAVALGAASAPAAPAGPFYKPTDAQKAAFASAHAVSLLDLDGYVDGVNTAQNKIAPLADKTNEAAILEYAAFGYRADGTRWTWTKVDLAAARAMCDRLEAAPTANAANDVIAGAGNVQPRVAQVLVLSGAFTGGGPFLSPRLMTGLLDATATVADAAAYLIAKPGPAGPGIG